MIFSEPKSGPAIFARHAADIALSLQELHAQPGSRGIFIHRLTFAVKYAQFHHLRMKSELEDAASDLVAMFHDDIAPKSWWGVLLSDSVELLQCGPYFSLLWCCWLMLSDSPPLWYRLGAFIFYVRSM
jgi:nuclear pore complex protein Nup85